MVNTEVLEKKDTRSGFGAGLLELGRTNPEVVALCADLTGSLKMNAFEDEFPERFSPNVVMRPIYQEHIMPNLAYIGGGGELAYWFQLKSYFRKEEVTFPILLLRNSALLMSKKLLFVFFLFFGLKTTHSQNIKLSVYSEVSIITVGPGNELFEAFGHSAIRIKDPVLNLDLVYNYGMFDFNAPNFYLNFVKGDLLYKLGRYPFYIFENSNKRDQRWMKSQLLNLTQDQRQSYFEFLEINASPKNASYYYDPYFNNCATKLIEISNEILVEKITFSDDYIQENETLRSLMLKEIPWNTWGSFGINLLLGNKLDKTATAEEYLYLPDYVFLAFKNGEISKKTEGVFNKVTNKG